MKRENLKRSIEIDKIISEYEEKIKLLGYNTVNVKIKYYHNDGDFIFSFYTTGDDIPSKLTAKYIEALKLHYETEINELKKELETL